MNNKTLNLQANQSASRFIYVDGSTPNNQKSNAVSGIAAVIFDQHNNLLSHSSEHLKDVSDNARAELYALLIGLTEAQCGDTVLSDSEYCVKGFNEWVNGWEARGWRRADKKPVANRDLWELIHAIKADVSVSVVKVKAHDGIYGNELADKLAYAAAQKEATRVA